MKIFRASHIPSEGGDPKTFTGTVTRTTLASDTAGTAVNVYRVEFEPGARTHWHAHDGPQWLFVVEGRIRVQKLGEPATEVSAGDAIVVQPGEKHWHGATSTARGVHLAVNVNAKTSWMEPVTDEQYRT
ncbi:MAG TPA: cupin domain-containing protein [Vicinamibacterales bacterium]|nr:cupin domain-containing protein [Vicinamibacterales bacterium]